jgi:D-alanyl-lipoteichoic acid acyltransferase DltB (MBOAT superfamily)
LNLILTFTISGFWHGANWTFVIWGFLNGLYCLPAVLRGPHRNQTEMVAMGRFWPTPLELFQICRTFTLILFAWIFFRATTFSQAIGFITHIGTSNWLAPLSYAKGLLYVLLIFSIDWVQRDKQHPLEITHLPRPIRWAIYYSISTIILLVGKTGHVPFIYFQF